MSPTFDITQLQPWDHLLYWDPRSPIDWLIAEKTYMRVGHIEVYNRANISLASRNFVGVNYYPLRTNGLVCVRRPDWTIDTFKGRHWFDNVAKGQGYDLLGLMCFTLAVKHGSPHKMYCSEFALRLDRNSGFEPLNPDQDADKTPPALFWNSSEFNTIWQKPGYIP